MRFAVTTMLSLGLALGACNKNGAGDATANADTGLTAEAISANDVTAIDAVTGAAANMAADVDYANAALAELDNGGQAANQSSGASKSPRPRASKPAPDGLTDPVHRSTDEAPAPATPPPATNQQ